MTWNPLQAYQSIVIVAHLPAGYLLTYALKNRFKQFQSINQKQLWLFGLLGSVFPDLDMLYFYLIDHRQHHHHRYWTHLPIFWLSFCAAVFFADLIFKKYRSIFLLTFIFEANVILHLILDTIVGDIWWLYPFVDQPFRLATVPALYQPWWLNFIFHWSFLLEVSAIVAAAVLFRKKMLLTGDPNLQH